LDALPSTTPPVRERMGGYDTPSVEYCMYIAGHWVESESGAGMDATEAKTVIVGL
jgi:hypothetical protein